MEGTLYSLILIPTDGSDIAGKAVQDGVALAQVIGAKVTALTVLLPFHMFTTDTQMLEDTRLSTKHACSRMRKTLDAVAHAAQATGVAREIVHVEHEHLYRAIIDTAESRGCDIIIMPSHGRHKISALILGSETIKVLTRSKIPVLVPPLNRWSSLALL
jgi:nucleotide-binding universal stress UspA family protein